MSRLNSISAVVTLFRDQIHSLESNTANVTGDGTTTPGPEDVEIKKKASGATAAGIPILAESGATDTDTKKKASVHAILGGKDEQICTEEDALLVFSEDSLKKLQSRTEELKSERAMQKNKFRYLYRRVG